jgi:hypothetical protein
MKVNDELLIENAILAFLHNYPTHTWVNEYNDLLGRIKSGQYTSTKTRKRGRPAKRQRTKETSSNTTSEEKN